MRGRKTAETKICVDEKLPRRKNAKAKNRIDEKMHERKKLQTKIYPDKNFPDENQRDEKKMRDEKMRDENLLTKKMCDEKNARGKMVLTRCQGEISCYVYFLINIYLAYIKLFLSYQSWNRLCLQIFFYSN